jgi:hypothetical protein
LKNFTLITVADATVTLTYNVRAEDEDAARQLLDDGDLPGTSSADWEIAANGNGEEVVSVVETA